MKNEINKSVMDALTIKFGNLFASDVLKKVAGDRSNIIADDVCNFIKNRATKGVSKSFIIREYLVDSTPIQKKSDTTSGEDKTSDSQNHNEELNLSDFNLTGRIGDVN